MTEFDLRTIVRDICADSDVADPVVLAGIVLDNISAEDTRTALEQALPTVVRTFVARSRGSHQAPEPSTDDVPAPRQSTEQRSPVPAPRTAAPSWKVRAIRTEHAALGERYPVAPGGVWKFLRACTSADLTYAAELRENHAAATAANAAKLRELDKMLSEYGVDTVAELPESVIADIMNGSTEAIETAS